MLDQDLLDWTSANYEAIAVAAEIGPDAPIPSCPGWTMNELLSHASNTINGWFAYNAAREPDDLGMGSALRSAPPEPEGWAARVAHLRAGARRFADLVHTTDLDRPVWTFDLPMGRARFWLLRAATESAIHRWDAEGVVGGQTKMPANLGAASVDETLRGIWRSVYLEATGGGRGRIGSITIPRPPASLGIELGPNGLPEYPGATVREAPGLSVSGDADLVDAWNFGVHSEM